MAPTASPVRTILPAIRPTALPCTIRSYSITADHGGRLFVVERYGVLNIEGMVDRTLESPLVYLDTGQGGQPTLQIIAPDNQRTASRLYAFTGGTVPHLTILTSAVLNLDAPNGLMLNSTQVLPGTLTGTHGEGAKLQTSDTSSTTGDLPMYAPDGSLTDSGYGRGRMPRSREQRRGRK